MLFILCNVMLTPKETFKVKETYEKEVNCDNCVIQLEYYDKYRLPILMCSYHFSKLFFLS